MQGVEFAQQLDASEKTALNAAVSKTQIPASVFKKIRKPYTITKQRESWTEVEHEKFLQALKLFERDWKKIEKHIGTKTVIQIRSHAQKFFLKVQKSGTGEHVPPPRPKKKSKEPYPHKEGSVHAASKKNASSQAKQGTDTKFTKSGDKSQNKVGDFVSIYKYLSSIFDPSKEMDVETQLQKILDMPRIDQEVCIYLMYNLSQNLQSNQMWQQQQHLMIRGLPNIMSGKMMSHGEYQSMGAVPDQME